MSFLLGVLSSAVEQDCVARNSGMSQSRTPFSGPFLQDSSSFRGEYKWEKFLSYIFHKSLKMQVLKSQTISEFENKLVLSDLKI